MLHRIVLFLAVALIAGCAAPSPRVVAEDPAAQLAAAAFAKADSAVIDCKLKEPRPPALGPAQLRAWFVTGSGHGGNLEVVTAAGDATGMTLHRYRFSNRLRTAEPKAEDYPESSGTTSLDTTHLPPDQAGVLADAWGLIGTATVQQIEKSQSWTSRESLPDGSIVEHAGAGGRRELMSSSSDFVVSARIDNGGSTLTKGRFCGYRGSDSALPSCRPRALVEALKTVTEKASWQVVVAPTAAQRSLFAEIFLAHAREFADPDGYWWWVRERALLMAAHFGDRSLVPAILPLLAAPAPEVLAAVRTDASLQRSRYQAATALAGITGSDLRFAADGRPLPIDETATTYRKLLAGR